MQKKKKKPSVAKQQQSHHTQLAKRMVKLATPLTPIPDSVPGHNKTIFCDGLNIPYLNPLIMIEKWFHHNKFIYFFKFILNPII